MNSLKSLATSGLLFLAFAAVSYAQPSRDVGARSIILDNGTGGTLKINFTYSGDNLAHTWDINIPNPSNLQVGNAQGQTLYWDNTSLSWVKNNLLNVDPSGAVNAVTVNGTINALAANANTSANWDFNTEGDAFVEGLFKVGQNGTNGIVFDGNARTITTVSLGLTISPASGLTLSPTAGTTAITGGLTLTGFATGVIHSTAGVLSSTTVNLASATEVSGILTIPNGGTGVGSTYTNGDILYYNNGASSTALQKLAIGATGTVLHGGALPSYGAVNIAPGGDVTGTLAVGNGGTGQVSFTTNGVLYGQGASAIANTGVSVSSGQFLQTTLAGDPPTWATILAVANGGTGQNTIPVNAVIYGNGVGGFLNTGASSANGQFLQTTTTGTTPTWATILGTANGGTGASSLAGANIPTGTGTNGTLTKWTGANTLGNSIVSEAGAVLTVAGDLVPEANNTRSIGQNVAPLKWKDLWLGGNANIAGSLTAGASTLTGTALINSSGTAASTIGNSLGGDIILITDPAKSVTIEGTGGGATNIGNTSKITSILGAPVNINNAGIGFATNIGNTSGGDIAIITAPAHALTLNGTGGGSTTLGNSSQTLGVAASTATVTGLTNINLTGTAATHVGNATAGLTVDNGGLTVTLGGAAITGTTNINTSGAAATTLGVAGGATVAVNTDRWSVTTGGVATFSPNTNGATAVTASSTTNGASANTALSVSATNTLGQAYAIKATNGAVVFSTATAASTGACTLTIPDNVTVVKITAGGGCAAAIAITMPAGIDGQNLYLYNSTGNNTTGTVVNTGTTVHFIYFGGWQVVQ